MFKKSYFLLFLFPFSVLPCGDDLYEYDMYGLVPIYNSIVFYDKIELLPPRTLTKDAKIYVYGKYIFAIERNEGVHIINNEDPAIPIVTHFLRVYGCNDLSVKDDMMYIDNLTDLITIDISRIEQPIVVDRIPNLYHTKYGKDIFPKNYYGYFECIDETKGTVLAWVSGELYKPQCRK